MCCMKQLLVTIAFATCILTCPNMLPAEVKTDPKLQGLRERWTSIMRELDIPGVAIVAVRGDEVVLLETIGLRDVEKNKPANADTMFYIASCTKSFLSVTVLTLV